MDKKKAPRDKRLESGVDATSIRITRKDGTVVYDGRKAAGIEPRVGEEKKP